MEDVGCLRASTVTVVLLATMACGSGDDGGGTSTDFPSGTTCGLRMKFVGEVNDAFESKGNVACLAQLGGAEGIDVGFVKPTPELTSRVEIAVEDVKRAETGSGFPATVGVEHVDGRRWNATSCSVDITQQEFSHADQFAEHYTTRGAGSCSAPATRDPGGSSYVSIEPFAFAVTVPWTP